MPPTFTLETNYETWPMVSIRISDPETGANSDLEAMIDTGADITILDLTVARQLGVDFTGAEHAGIRGIGGRIQDVPIIQIEISILGADDLTATVRAAFVENASSTFGNLIGLDALESIDFGLSHAERRAFFGPPS